MKPKCWTHPKFAKLKMMLKTSKVTTAGILEGIWHLAATFSEETGMIPFSASDLMDWMELEECACGFDSERLLTALIASRFVDKNGDNHFVHGWLEHRPSYLQDRIRKRKQRGSEDQLSRDCPSMSRDCHDPSASASASGITSKSTDTPTNGQLSRDSHGTGEPSKKHAYTADFELWYQGYPHKVGKWKAQEAFTKAVKQGAVLTLMMSKCSDYVQFLDATTTPPKHPATWLNGREWETDWISAIATCHRPNAQKSLPGVDPVAAWLKRHQEAGDCD